MTEQALEIAVTVTDDVSPVTDEAVNAAAKYDPRARELEIAKQLWVDIELEVRRGKLEPGEELSPDDIRTVQDSFDGATTLDSLIHRLLLEMIDLDTVAPGIDAVVTKLQARKARAAKGIAWNRALIERAMVMANWIGKNKAFKTDVATVSCRPATATVEVVNEAAIPAQYFERADPKLDKSALNKKVLGRYRAMNAALALRDQTEREQALAKVLEEFGPEVPGAQVKVDGHTTTITFT